VAKYTYTGENRYLKYLYHEDSNVIEILDFGGEAGFSLRDTLECGQCFRFIRDGDGVYTGVVRGIVVQVEQRFKPDRILFYNTTPEEFHAYLVPYFDLERDYAAIKKELAADPVMKKAVSYAPGIRVLQQEGWEALCSFIISQNNNVKRIQGIVSRLCEGFGEPIGDTGYKAFPTSQRLAGCTLTDLEALRCGFRAKYLLDAARKVAEGRLTIEDLYTLPMEEARLSLRQIHGVGPKVAECALLYGFQRMEGFPVDVWIGRAMDTLFPEGLPECAKPYAGIAQQYIFHYVRTNKEALAQAQ